jgi:PAS domain S-box-containing protein
LKLKLKLSDKGIILVAIPLVFELVFVAALASLHAQAEDEAARALHSGRINNASNKLVRDIFEIASISRGEISKTLASTKYEDAVKTIRADIEELKQVVKDNPSQSAIVARSALAAEKANQVLENLRQTYESGDPFAAIDAFSSARNELRAAMKEMVSPELLSMAQAEKEIEEKSPEIQRKLRDKVKLLLIGGVAVNIGITIFVALLLSKKIVRRIEVLLDNSFRLASGLPLNEPAGGSDEIANLELSLHGMAQALEEAKHRERALIDNAIDVICSLDGNLRFTQISPACQKVFGYCESELIGSNLSKLLVDDQSERTVELLNQIPRGELQAPIEASIRRKDGKVIDLIFSVQWVPSEKSMFCVAHDITERKDAERLKEQVTAMVSHDLRTPLATIRTFHEMLSTGMFGELSERGRQLLEVADSNSDRMLTLINDLLDIEKIKSGHLKLNLVEVKLQPVLERAVEAIANWAGRVEVKLELVPTSLAVIADEDRLMQILVNLLSNAVKFSPKDSNVTICAGVKEERVFVSIADHGRGVPSELKEKIFDRFQQVLSSDSKEKGGSGLGLAICKALVELHGGTIQAIDNQGGGSNFIFTLLKAPGGLLPDEQSLASTSLN